jgi:isoquinoline 1-oxidoreductase beta subunit
VQRNVAQITGHDAGQVHVHVEIVGGSFGRRLEDGHVRRAAEVAMALPGRAVKVTWRREGDMAQDAPRQIAVARGRGRVTAGRVEAIDLAIAMPSVTASQMERQGLSVPGADPAIVFGAFDQPFAVPHARVTGYRAPPLAPVGAWRAVGASTNVFFHESLMDELIAAAGADPLQERLRLCHHAPSRAVLEAVGEMCGWAGRDIGPGRGRGLAFGLSFGVPVAEVADVTLTDRGLRVDDVWVAAEVGRVLDPETFVRQVEGGVIWALGHAIAAETTFAGGRAEQVNYDTYPAMRIGQAPRVHVLALEGGEPVRGIGEPMVPPAAPALAAAVFAATGERLREMPFRKAMAFV